MTVSRRIVLEMRNDSDKSCGEYQKMFYVESFFFFFRMRSQTLYKCFYAYIKIDQNLLNLFSDQ